MYPAGWVFRFAPLTLNRPGRLWLEELDNPYAQTARAVSVEKGGDDWTGVETLYIIYIILYVHIYLYNMYIFNVHI